MPENSELVERVAQLLWRDGYKYKKAGIVLGDISPVSVLQADWLEATKTADIKLMEAIDGLNTRFGRGLPYAMRIIKPP